MNYTNEEFATLQRNEKHLSSALNAWWVRNIPAEEVSAMRDIDVRYEGEKEAFARNCDTCVLTMCRRLAPAYFADKVEREQAASETPVAEVDTPKKAARKRVKVEA